MRWLKVRQAAEYAGGLSARTVYAAIKAGKLRAARIGAGRSIVVAQEWVDAWLAEASADSTPKPGERPAA
jgi:excisionase family DNA binding protein